MQNFSLVNILDYLLYVLEQLWSVVDVINLFGANLDFPKIKKLKKT